MTRLRRLIVAAVVLVALATALPAAGAAQIARSAGIPDDDRLLGHLPYVEADPAMLASVPAGVAVGQPCRLRATVLPDLARLLAAEAAAGLGATLHAVSCFRSVARQQAVFHRGEAGSNAQHRALSVGLPGHSEHATGFAIDLGVRPARGCADVSDCIADTAAGRWLLANGPAYGFELSFPAGNAQGVAYEPWHWRWVGTSQDEPGAADARATLADARVRFPAHPEAAGFALPLTAPPDPPPFEPSSPDQAVATDNR